MSVQFSLLLEAVGHGISIRCDHAATMEVLREHFDGMTVPAISPDLRYRICAEADGFGIERRGRGIIDHAPDLGRLLYMLDSDLIIQLQRLRPDLLFVHAAVVTYGGGAHLLVGRSGAGKSTTCLGLLSRGMGYLSDELAPIRVADAMVQPFPRALCMKAALPDAHPIAPGVSRTSRGFHVPVSSLPSRDTAKSSPVRTLLFVQYDAHRCRPGIRAVGRAEAAARLHANVLNALVHANGALPAVLRVAAAARAFVVETAELSATCDAIHGILCDQ